MFNKWKEVWWAKNVEALSREYSAKKEEIISHLEEDLKQTKKVWDNERLKLQSEIDLGEHRLSILQEDITYRKKLLEDRRMELILADNKVKEQIKLLEAKASPSGVWAEAFTLGVSKCWDLLLPAMTENIDKMKTRIKEDCAREAIGRFNATNKK